MSKMRILEAVQNLDVASTIALLDAKPDLLHVTDRQGRNLLHLACSASCTRLKVPESVSARMVNMLLDRGVDIESPLGGDSCGGCTALWFAVGRGRNPTLVKLLIERGASPARAPGAGLFAAGWYEDTHILDLLIRAGAAVDVVEGMTPFLACWMWKKFDAAKFLAKKGADVNYQDPKTGKTALHHGVEKEVDPALLKWLVKHGASPDIEDRQGVTARLRASRKREKKWLAALGCAMLLLVFVLCAPAIAQDLARMDQVVTFYSDEAKTFMGAALVAREGQVLISRGYGSANLEWAIPNTPRTKFRLGSITKQFTAAAILLLEERGKLRVDDPVKKHLTDAPAAWDQVTIFHLLTHTSGIPSFTGFPEYRTAKLISTTAEKIAASFRDKTLEFPPGEKWNYSNSGYLLLGYLIERISGQTYEQFIRENIFTPLGMKDSGYDSNRTVIAQRASGYSPSPDGPVNAEFIHMSVPHAAGALYSTTEDLLHWTQGLFERKLLSPASLQKMTTPFKNDYAFGLTVRTVNGRRVFDHGGGIEGFNTMLAYYPDTRLTVAVLSNLNGPASGEIASKLGAVAHGETVTLSSERKEIMVAPEVLARYVGTYEVTPTLNMTIALVDGKLMTQLGGQRALPLFAESETTFFLKVVDAQVEFVSDRTGAVTHAIMRQGGRDQKAVRR